MMEEYEEKRVTQYLIPANVSTKFEFFPGFGWYEFKIVFIAGVIGTALFFVLGLPKKTVHVDNISFEQTIGINPDEVQKEKRVQIIPKGVQVFAIIIPCITAFFLVKRNPNNNMSLLVMLKSSKEFKARQKLYLYKYNSGSEGN